MSVKGPYPIVREGAAYQIHRTVAHPRFWLVFFLFAGFLMLLVPMAGGVFVAAYPLLVVAIIIGLRLTHMTGKDVSVSADVLRLGDRILRRSDLDYLYATPKNRLGGPKCWFAADHGERIGFFDADEDFAIRTMRLLALDRARVSAREGERGRCVVEATPEGILIKRDAGTRRLRWDRIEGIHPEPTGFVVQTKAGDLFSFDHLRGHLAGTEVQKEMAVGFVERANELQAEHAPAERHDLLARVSAALEGDGAFRGMPVERADLWSVLESSAASPEVRVKAANLLAREEKSRTRFRLASAWCDEPKVRVALEKILNEPEEQETHAASFPEAKAR